MRWTLESVWESIESDNRPPAAAPRLPHHRWPAGYRCRLHASLFCYR